jgi:hypothetical protein
MALSSSLPGSTCIESRHLGSGEGDGQPGVAKNELFAVARTSPPNGKVVSRTSMSSATVLTEVVFLSPADGGRQQPPELGAALTYRPQVVVQDRQVRQARVRDGNVVDEPYLGVTFLDGPREIRFGEPAKVLLGLDYPNVDYSSLSVGAAFTVREGAKIVGHGIVIETRRAG